MAKEVLGWRTHEKVLKLRVFTREVDGRWLAQVPPFDVVTDGETEDDAIRAAVRQTRSAYARVNAPRDLTKVRTQAESTEPNLDVLINVREAHGRITLELDEPVSRLSIDSESAVALAVAILLRAHPAARTVRGKGNRQ